MKNPLKKRPKDLDPKLYCNACQAIIKEVCKKLRKSRSIVDVVTAMEGICNMRNFYVYEFTPPEMKKGCDAFMGGWEELIEKEL